VPPALPKLPNLDMVWLAIPIALLIYALLLYDTRRAGSPAAGDDQLGIKTVAATLSLVGTWVLADGLRGFLQVILTFDDFWDKLKAALPSLLVGTLVVVGVGMVLFARTNAAQYPKAKRLAAGVVALTAGVALVPALVVFLDAVLEWPSWRVVATALATVIDAGVVFVVALVVLGKLSGVRMPERMAGGGAARPGGLGQPLGGVVQPMQPMQQQGYAGAPQGYAAPQAQPAAPGYVAPGTQPPGYPPQG
jgi:hypothetical protein